jgi:hypothetical protein
MKHITIPKLAGMNEMPNAKAYEARSIRGMRYDASEGRWVSDRGYESFWPNAPSRGAPDNNYVFSMHLHQTLGGATKDIIVERGDNDGTVGLYRIDPLDNSGIETIQTSRHRPGVNETGTCFVSFGRVAVAVNGWDQPLRIYPHTATANGRVEPFGFPQTPAACLPAEMSNSSVASSATAYSYSKSISTTDVTTAYPAQNTVGLGTSTVGSTNSYKYRYTWVTDTGSESPMSAESSVVNWRTPATHTGSTSGFRYGILITGIQPGPAGTVKRRLYRTNNMGETQLTANATYFFVAEIPNNFETTYTDHKPDGFLGSEGPGLVDSAPLPTDIRWITMHAGRLWAVAGDYRVHWSQPGQIESFGATNYVDVSGRNGGRVTGLLPHNDVLIVFRENAIEAILPSGDTWRASTISDNIGSTAPHAAIALSDWGVIFVANDGIYAVQGSYTGGGKIGFQELTTNIAWDRVNTAALARAWAWANPRDREITFALPADGQVYPNLHLVLHLDAGEPGVPAWSQREGIQSGCGIVGPEQWPYIGDHGQYLSTTLQKPLLFSVWAAYDQYGYASSDATYATPAPRPDTWWESTDLDFGNPDQTKIIKHITAQVSAYGDQPIYLDCYLDSKWYTAGTTQQTTTHIQDRQVLNVLGTAVVGTDTFSKRIISQVRFDVALLQTRRIRLRFRSSSVWALYGFTVHFDDETGPDKPDSPVTRSTTFNHAQSVNLPITKLPGGFR